EQGLRMAARARAARCRRRDCGCRARRARGRGLSLATPAGEGGLALARALEQVRGNAARALGDLLAGVGRGGRDFFDRLGRARVGGGSFLCRRRVVAVFALHGETERLAALAATTKQVFGNLGHGALRLPRAYSGPETPPSLRTLQK